MSKRLARLRNIQTAKERIEIKMLSKEQRVYLKWLLNEKFRIVKSKRELASILGVDESMLSYWDSLPSFQAAKFLASERWGLLDILPDVSMVLRDRLLDPTKDGDRARETYFRYLLPDLRAREASGIYDFLEQTDVLASIGEVDIRDALEKFSPNERELLARMLDAISQSKMLTIRDEYAELEAQALDFTRTEAGEDTIEAGYTPHFKD